MNDTNDVVDLDTMSDPDKIKLIHQLTKSMQDPDTVLLVVGQHAPPEGNKPARVIFQHGPLLLILALVDLAKSFLKAPIVDDYKRQIAPQVLRPDQIPPDLRSKFGH